MSRHLRIGTAHWNVPFEAQHAFPERGSHLERYSRGLPAVEINSSFYRHHLAKTYKRWAASTPPDFRFSVKLARAFTHEAKLVPSGDSLRASLEAIGELGEKFGCLLVQLPPSLAFEHSRAENFLGFLKELCPAPMAWEPRHQSWAQPEALAVLAKYGACKVIADPEPCPAPAAASRGPGFPIRYYRLHGSPIIYRSRYRPHFLTKVAADIREGPARDTWCIFDNTTFGFATLNALELMELLHGRAGERIVS